VIEKMDVDNYYGQAKYALITDKVNITPNEVTDFYKDGIFDSTKVLRIALENAVHTACNFALINATVS
jgi:chaperonin GroEL (HSP60 family)